jgi:NDP-sugar pyrophosphorylase family protein
MIPEKNACKIIKLNEIDVLILCGGFGRRLQGVIKKLPKPMAEIGNRPFLDILIDYISGFGFRHFILCLGYMGDIIKRHYQKRDDSLKILFSQENRPLGTAGALKHAETLIKSNPFLVMNGDSLCPFGLDKFLDFYINKKALFALVLAKAKPGKDYGVVSLGSNKHITQFKEKPKAKENDLINAGIYLFEKSILSMIPSNRNFSLEYDLFPKIINKRFYGYVVEEELLDIGTPERYEKAKAAFQNI